MKTCTVTGKVRHVERGSAEKARQHCQKKRGCRLHVYLCEHCKGFHLASNTR